MSETKLLELMPKQFDRNILSEQQKVMAIVILDFFKENPQVYFDLATNEVNMNLFYEEFNRIIIANSQWSICPQIISLNENLMREEEFYIFKQRCFSGDGIHSSRDVYRLNFELAVVLNSLRIKKMVEKAISENADCEQLSFRRKLQQEFITC